MSSPAPHSVGSLLLYFRFLQNLRGLCLFLASSPCFRHTSKLTWGSPPLLFTHPQWNYPTHTPPFRVLKQNHSHKQLSRWQTLLKVWRCRKFYNNKSNWMYTTRHPVLKGILPLAFSQRNQPPSYSPAHSPCPYPPASRVPSPDLQRDLSLYTLLGAGPSLAHPETPWWALLGREPSTWSPSATSRGCEILFFPSLHCSLQQSL